MGDINKQKMAANLSSLQYSFTDSLYRLIDSDFTLRELEYLLENGACCNKVFNDGLSSFHKIMGIDHKSQEFLIPAIKVMLNYSADPNLRSNDGLSPVHIAAMWGKDKLLMTLLDCGGDPYLSNPLGENAFTFAKKNNEYEVLLLLNQYRKEFYESDSIDCDLSTYFASLMNIEENLSSIENKQIHLSSAQYEEIQGPYSSDEFSSILPEDDILNLNRSVGDSVESAVSHSDKSDATSIYKDIASGAEIIEKDASSDPSIITVDSSLLNDSDNTEIYDWKMYKDSSPNHQKKEVLNKSLLLTLPEYSKELELCLRGSIDSNSLRDLENVFRAEFEFPDPSVKWREGLHKSSFNYMLLDSRITKNLPHRSETLSEQDCFRIFIAAIFYIGKGKLSRPYSHLHEALNKTKNNANISKKERHILEIWKSGLGVISLHCFQNVIPSEALTREAMMIESIGLQNLTNIRKGDRYGQSVKWTGSKRRKLGAYFLKKAMKIFLLEGEKLLYPINLGK